MDARSQQLVKKEELKRGSKVSGRKGRMLAATKVRIPLASKKLCEAYSKKTEWATKLLPELKKDS